MMEVLKAAASGEAGAKEINEAAFHKELDKVLIQQ